MRPGPVPVRRLASRATRSATGGSLDLDGPVRLERGGALPAVRVAYETWGTLGPDGGNAVLVEHALTGDSHVVGPAGPGHADAPAGGPR